MYDDITLTFWFGSDDESDACDLEITIDKEEFEKDKLLILTCAFVAMTYKNNYLSVYDGISTYLAHRFPEYSAEYFSNENRSLYDCTVLNLRNFEEMLKPLLGVGGKEGRERFEKMIEDYNIKHFSIWK